MAKIQIQTIKDAQPLEIDSGLHIYDIYVQHPEAFPVHPQGYFPVAATVNNYLVALSDKLTVSCQLEMVYFDTVIGGEVYRRSLIFLVGLAWSQLFPQQSLQISHSIDYFYYFYIKAEPGNELPLEKSADGQRYLITEDQVSQVKATIAQLVGEDVPILSTKPVKNEKAIEILTQQHMSQSAELLKEKNETKVFLSQCKNYYQIAHSPLVAKTSQLQYHDINMCNNMLILTYPSTNSPTVVPKFRHNAPFSSIYEEYGRWAGVMGIQCVGQLNAINRSEKFRSYLQVCESRQNQMLANVCELIMNGAKSQNGPMTIQESMQLIKQKSDAGSIIVGNLDATNDCIKLVMISGPSSSGKTTFAKKLQYNLTVMGRSPLVLSMDNYFVNREDTPLGDDGKYDFEHLEAVDIALFNDHLGRILSGEIVETPVFDFKTGKRTAKTAPVSFPARGIVIIEGIHALNPVMTRSVPIEQKFGVFIQPLPCIALDDRTRLSTRDYRLFRRIIRDRKYRNCSAERTIQLFANVRRGEDRWIFPNQQRADVYFNTALDYELPVLGTLVAPLLHEIEPASNAYTEGRRLLSLLDWIQGVNQDYIPKHSLLREFIGGSGFSYD